MQDSFKKPAKNLQVCCNSVACKNQVTRLMSKLYKQSLSLSLLSTLFSTI